MYDHFTIFWSVFIWGPNKQTKWLKKKKTKRRWKGEMAGYRRLGPFKLRVSHDKIWTVLSSLSLSLSHPTAEDYQRIEQIWLALKTLRRRGLGFLFACDLLLFSRLIRYSYRSGGNWNSYRAFLFFHRVCVYIY